jgi:(2R)-sulfolactate sulfo-lyase subunit alpha
MAHAILLHEPTDDVGVAVRDLKVGEEVGAVTLDGELVGTVKLVNDVPLGHKVAMREMAQGKKVIEYGRPIGGASQAIVKGAHVHTHNLKTLRWAL